MLYIIGSIFSAAALVILFKVFERYQVNIFQTIVFNYITASIIALLANPTHAISPISTGFAISMIIIGVLFIAIFNLIGYAVSTVGVAPVSVAQKMSLVIPVVYGLVFLHETASIFKLIGLLMALIAIYLTTKTNEPKGKYNMQKILFPLLIFIGSGVVDSIIKYTQSRFITPANEQTFIAGTYAVCALTGVIFGAFLFFTKQLTFAWKNVWAGIALGIPNYFSMLFFIKALALPWLSVSVFFPVNNLGIICVSVLTATVLFKEKMTKQQLLGMFVAMTAIVLIAV